MARSGQDAPYPRQVRRVQSDQTTSAPALAARSIRIAAISRGYPYDDVDHAGGRYLVQLDRALSTFAEVTWIVPGTLRPSTI